MTNRGRPVLSRYFYPYYLRTLGENGKDSFASNDETVLGKAEYLRLQQEKKVRVDVSEQVHGCSQ